MGMASCGQRKGSIMQGWAFPNRDRNALMGRCILKTSQNGPAAGSAI